MRCRSRAAALWRGLVVVLLAAVVAGPARAVPLTQLLAGGTLQSGPLTFAGWSATDLSDVPLDLSAIDVTALPAAPGQGPGLTLQTTPFATQGDILELAFGFTVALIVRRQRNETFAGKTTGDVDRGDVLAARIPG